MMHKSIHMDRRLSVLSVVLGVVLLAVCLFSTAGLVRTAGGDGAQQLKEVLQHAAVLCYATEGFYPPSLSYIEQQYGIYIDRQRYAVWYEVFAANVLPHIQVVERGRQSV